VRTRVFITVDTEFDIAGTFGDPHNHKPVGPQNVLCEIEGRSEGLGFLLDTLKTHSLKATFFTEALQTSFFGDDPMGALARRIANAGQDVQLHLHPVWTYFEHPNWQQRLAREKPTDNIHGMLVAQMVGWMQRGIDTFSRWGLKAPVALRTGNLMVDRNVYRSMHDVGLKVSSNVARAVFEPEEPALRLNAGVRTIEGIIEIPVLTYAGLRLGSRVELKSLTITGTSVGEAICLLNEAHAQNFPAVVLLTHCHEFVKGHARSKLKTNRLNQARLVALTRFLRDEDDRFEVTTMADMVSEIGDGSPDFDPLLAVPATQALGRMFQNKLNDYGVL
jgi:hypothetical protein